MFPGALNLEGKMSDCVDPRSEMFIQYTCEESATESAYKYKHLSFISCILSFVATIFCLFFFYIRYSSKIAVLRYDVKTVEADDYTVQLMVS